MELNLGGVTGVLQAFNPNKIKANPKVVEYYKNIDIDVSTRKTPTIDGSSIFTYLTSPYIYIIIHYTTLAN